MRLKRIPTMQEMQLKRHLRHLKILILSYI